MKYTVRQAEHKARPRSLGLWKNKIILEREVIFHNSCKYSSSGENIEDINKLFGLGFIPKGGLLKALFGLVTQKINPEEFHHTDSARFGWVYNLDRNNIRIYSYTYVNKERIAREMLHVPLETRILFRITKTPTEYQYLISTPNMDFTQTVPYTHTKKWSYLLGLYFGGNLVAPHDTDVTMNKP